MIKTIDDVCEDVKKAYEEATKLSFVNNPVAYALYQVWREYDSKPVSREHER